MRSEVRKLIVRNEGKISITTHESTSLSKKACLIIDLRAAIKEKSVNLFLDLCELNGGQRES